MKGKAFIIAPNIGLHMGLGGGVRVTLAIAKTLEEAGYEPYLVALRGYSVPKLSVIHGIRLEKTTPLYLFGEGEPLRVPFSIQVSLLKIFLEKLLERYKPRIVIFNDDVPTINEKLVNDANVVLYSHFPYAARIKYNITDVYEVPPSKFKIYLEMVYRSSLKNLIYVDHVPSNIVLISNSTITGIFIKMMWNRSPMILYPPLIVKNNITVSSQNKEDLVVVLATLQPNKRVGDVIKAFSKLKHSKAKLIIAGHRGPPKYVEYLITLAKKLKVYDKVTFMVDIDEYEKWLLLAKSKVVVSAAHFEPFGINVVEGMYCDNIPVVYRGFFSGPWIDIVDKGRYGLGFKNIDELAELMDIALQDYDYIIQEIAPSVRAKEYRYELFSERLSKILAGYGI